ncbi:MAG: SCP2 sterol-binding domain-containing protein [Spirochaetes bacterium]|nr:SCP2 sterol-binding domain-containing protein [Spirochaetota bacterium]
MTEYWGVKAEDIFNTMKDRFRVEGAKGVDAVFGYDIEGAGKWKLTVKNDSMEVEKTDDLSGCVTIMKANEENFIGVNIGKVDATNAFMSGKVKLEGDMGTFGKTTKMFKKYVPAKKVMGTGDYIQDMFSTLVARFQPQGASGLDVSITYNIGGEGGGVWTAYIKDGKCELKTGQPDKPTTKLNVNEAKDWVDVMLGKTDPFSLLSAGRASIEGKTEIALKLGEIFAKYAPKIKEFTTKDYILDMFGTLVQRFQPKGAADLDATITYDIGGEGGGKWTAYIKDGKCELKEGQPEKPTTKLCVNEAKDWVDVMLGKTDPFSLLSAGRASIEGQTAIALKLGEIFSKYIPPSSGGEAEKEELLVLKKTISVNQRFATGPIMGRFLNALKEKKIFTNKCPKCGRVHLPAREVCAECRIPATEWLEVGPKGQVRYMEYVYFSSPDPLTGETRETPYGMLNILLDGCIGNDTFAHLVRRDQINLIKNGRNDVAGTRVRPVWNEKRVGSIFDIKYFEIDE